MVKFLNGNPDGYSYTDWDYELCAECTKKLEGFLSGKETDMSEVFMTINSDSKLYNDYFVWWNGREKMLAAANSVMDQFGIESKQFFTKKDRHIIVPTESDKKKFDGMLMKDGQSFKKRSAPNKAWVEAMKDMVMRKPQLFGYMPTSLLGCRWKEQLFHVDETLYCRIDSNGNAAVPDFATEIKGSEYYAVLESEKQKEGTR